MSGKTDKKVRKILRQKVDTRLGQETAMSFKKMTKEVKKKNALKVVLKIMLVFNVVLIALNIALVALLLTATI